MNLTYGRPGQLHAISTCERGAICVYLDGVGRFSFLFRGDGAINLERERERASRKSPGFARREEKTMIFSALTVHVLCPHVGTIGNCHGWSKRQKRI